MNYNNSEFLASYGLSRQLPDSDRPEIVFSGRSNVGKSSLINKLCNRKKLARVSATPGKRPPSTFTTSIRPTSLTCPATVMPRFPTLSASGGTT